MEENFSIKEKKNNWIFGNIDKYRFEAEYTNQPSSMGINDGRISKLFLFDNKTLIASYERGYDEEIDKSIIKTWNKLIEYLEKELE